MTLINDTDSDTLKEKLMGIIHHHHFPTVEGAERKVKKAEKWLGVESKKANGGKILTTPPSGIKDGIALLARCQKARMLHQKQLQQAKAHIKTQVHPEGKGEHSTPVPDA